MAVTRREQQMLDLHERGLRPPEIAREMGISRGSVTRTLGMLSVNLAADRRQDEVIARGSRELLAAMKAAGYHAVPGETH